MVLVLPNPEQQLLILKECHEDIETRDRDLQHIKDWLLKQPHLPDTFEEQALINFLRGCNYSLQRAKKKIDSYFTMRTILPEFFADRDIDRPEFMSHLKIGEAAYMPNLTPDGKRVGILRGFDKKMEFTPNMVAIMKIGLMGGDIRLIREKYGVAGEAYIFDASALTAGLFARAANPIALKKFFICCQHAYPLKLKEIHVIFPNSLVDTCISYAMKFAPPKIRKRVFVHNNLESLYAFVPKEVLPEEYGGYAGKLSEITKSWIKELQKYKQWFKEQENIKADESKRPGNPTNYDDLFGLDGSFKQLSID